MQEKSLQTFQYYKEIVLKHLFCSLLHELWILPVSVYKNYLWAHLIQLSSSETSFAEAKISSASSVLDCGLRQANNFIKHIAVSYFGKSKERLYGIEWTHRLLLLGLRNNELMALFN